MTGEELHQIFYEESLKNGELLVPKWPNLPKSERELYYCVVKRLDHLVVDRLDQSLFKQIGSSFQDATGAWYIVDKYGKVMGPFLPPST